MRVADAIFNMRGLGTSLVEFVEVLLSACVVNEGSQDTECKWVRCVAELHSLLPHHCALQYAYNSKVFC